MKNLSKILLSSTLIVAGSFAVTRTAAAPAADDSLMLWYRQPAGYQQPTTNTPTSGRRGGFGRGGQNNSWLDALPVGNGRIGAMVFGGVNREQIQLNEDT